MDCNVCEGTNAEVTELGYVNGDSYEMNLCSECRRRFIADRTVHDVRRFQAP